MTERWLPVVGYEGWYEVSDQGRVRRSKAGCGTRVGRILTSQLKENGYAYINLSRHGHHLLQYVHILVAKAFLGPVPKGKEVNHKNVVKADNRLINLEYLTRAENLKHAIGLGRIARGTQVYSSKLNEENVSQIKKQIGKEPMTVIAARYGVSKTCVLKIARGKTWRHVG